MGLVKANHNGYCNLLYIHVYSIFKHVIIHSSSTNAITVNVTRSLHTEIHPRRGPKTNRPTGVLCLDWILQGRVLYPNFVIWSAWCNKWLPARWAWAYMTWAYLQSNMIKATRPKKKRVNLPGADACWDVSNVAVNARITCDIFYQEKKLHQFQATRICPTTWCPILCCWWSCSSLFTLFHIFMHIICIFSRFLPLFSHENRHFPQRRNPGEHGPEALSGARPPLTSVRDRPS